LHPTINDLDSLPVKMFEYMAAGLPIIASNFPYWESIVLKYNVGLCVDPMDPQQIAKAVNWLIDNPKEAKAMGENGKQTVEKLFNWDREKRKLIDTYNKVLNN
jgi:glycosyltransferase involved in cell wall biosynthesis